MQKTKNVSILSSDKLMCDLHKFRYELAHKCKREKLCDTFGTFDNGDIVQLSDTLKNYKFSICIENDIKPYFFTERITTAFLYKTVPIYLGASEIDKFFNPDGIIKIKKGDDIEKILKQCTQKEYENRLDAIEENYNLAKKYGHFWDYIYEYYINNSVSKRKADTKDFLYNIKQFNP